MHAHPRALPLPYTHTLHSLITRDGVAALKENFQEEMTTEDWKLLSKIKSMFARGVRHW
jgi:hypothetical protein